MNEDFREVLGKLNSESQQQASLEALFHLRAASCSHGTESYPLAISNSIKFTS